MSDYYKWKNYNFGDRNHDFLCRYLSDGVGAIMSKAEVAIGNELFLLRVNIVLLINIVIWGYRDIDI